ncbi:MAG: lysostaphin resistance A-like protein [Salinigranum sp.]
MSGPARGAVGRATAWFRRALVTAFWNRAERRLRAPWRLTLGLLLFGVLGVLPGVVLSVLPGGRALSAPLARLVGSPLGVTAATALLTVVGVALAGRFLDRRRFSDFGLHFDRDFRVELAVGLALGAGLQTLVFLVELGAGWLVVTGVGGAPGLGSALAANLALFALVGVYEELLVRGYLLTNLLEGLSGVGPIGPRGGAALAALGSAGVFGVLHAGNPSATPVSVLTVSVAGLLFALAYLWTGDLAVPIGLHVAWNFFEGPVYGFPVSGVGTGPSVVAAGAVGPTAYTGGAFGPEAGLAGLLALLSGTAVLAAWVRSRRGGLGLAPGVETPDLRWR